MLVGVFIGSLNGGSQRTHLATVVMPQTMQHIVKEWPSCLMLGGMETLHNCTPEGL